MRYLYLVKKSLPVQPALPTFLSHGYTQHNKLINSVCNEGKRLEQQGNSILNASRLVYDLETGYRIFQ